MSRIPRPKEPISITETIQGVISIIVIVAISMFFGHLYYVVTDPRVAYKGSYTVNEFVHNKTIKNFTLKNNKHFIFDFEETNEQLHILMYCEESYCLDKYFKELTFNKFNIIGQKIDEIIYTHDIFKHKVVDFQQTYQRRVIISFLNPLPFFGFVYFDAVIVIDTKVKVIDRSNFYKDIVANFIVNDGEIVLRS